MGVKVVQETPILHLGHPSKCIDWIKHEVNNGFLNDYAEKNKSEI